MHLGFQTHAGHAQRFTHTFLVIDHVILWQGVQHALVRRDGHGLGGVEYALQIRRAHFAIANGHNAVAVEAADMVAGHADKGRVNAATGHQLGFFHSALDRLHGGFDIDHHALLQTARRMGADADDFQLTVRIHFTDQRHHLGGTDIEADDHLAALHVCHGFHLLLIHCTTAASAAAGATGSRHATARPLA